MLDVATHSIRFVATILRKSKNIQYILLLCFASVNFFFYNTSFCPLCRTRVSMRQRYPVFIGRNQAQGVMPEPNVVEEPERNQQDPPQIIVEPEHEAQAQGQAVEFEPENVDEAEQNQQEPPQIIVEPEHEAQAQGQAVEFEPEIVDEVPAQIWDVAQEVEVPFEVDPAAQMTADLQMAMDLEMAELIAFEMMYDVLPTAAMEPKPKRRRRSPELLRNVELICVRCGKKVRRTDLPAEVTIDFICSENCMPDGDD